MKKFVKFEFSIYAHSASRNGSQLVRYCSAVIAALKGTELNGGLFCDTFKRLRNCTVRACLDVLAATFSRRCD